MSACAWLIRDDGIIDEVAIEIAVAGTRLVRLTRPEQRIAAARILARGGSIDDVQRNLGVGGDLAAKIVREVREAEEAEYAHA